MIKSKFIQDILILLLDGEEEDEEAKKQMHFVSETEFDYTGVGVFVSFEHVDGIEKFKAKKGDLILNGVTIKSPELEIGAESTLFFKNGLIDYLEIWSFNGEYPKKELSEYEMKQEWVSSHERKIERKK